MPNAFTTTLLFHGLTTLVAAFARGHARDRCLMSFSGDCVVLEIQDSVISGRLTVEDTGLEFVHPSVRTNSGGHHEASRLLYKFEYANIRALVRYHAQLSEEGNTARSAELRVTYHPMLFRRLTRQTWNTMKTVRDATLEVVDTLLNPAKRTVPGGRCSRHQTIRVPDEPGHRWLDRHLL